MPVILLDQNGNPYDVSVNSAGGVPSLSIAAAPAGSTPSQLGTYVPDQSGGAWKLSVNSTDGSLSIVQAPGVTVPAGYIGITALQLITAALKEIGALAPGEQPSNDDSADVLQKLQRVIDTFDAQRTMIFAYNFSQFTLQVNHQPHSIGPVGADFDVLVRPIEIPSIGLILLDGSGTSVEVPLAPRDKDWWAAQTIKGLSSTLPTDYYYEPDWPNGNIYFWPVPTAVNNVLIQQRQSIAQITAYTQSISMPPGYWDAIVYSLAEAISPMYERPVSADLLRLKTNAIKAVQGNNIKSPRMFSDSPSQSSSTRSRPDFNFLNGLNR